MSHAQLWIYALPFAIFFAFLILLLIGGILKWNDPSSQSIDKVPTKLPTVSKNEHHDSQLVVLRTFIRKHAWTLLLVAILAAILIFLFLTAPPRLTGKIPINPGQAGRPFYALRWLRNTLSGAYDLFWIGSTIITCLVCSVILICAAIRRYPLFTQVGLLSVSLALAALGQWMITPIYMLQAGIAYGVSILGFILWAWLGRERIKEYLSEKAIPPRQLEIAFLIGLFALAAFARLYAFPAVPYGIEGDEAKWTAEAVNVMLDGRTDSSGEYHRDALPVSYFMQAAFFRLFGAGIFAARLEVIITSILATLILYWLIRQIAPIPLAMLAAFLLSCSIFDITASRLANVESHVKLWPILTLALLAIAFRSCRWQLYALSGLALALGLLTYDTVWPLALVAILLGMLEIFLHNKDTLNRKAVRFAVFIFPSLLAIPLIIPYFISRIKYYNLGAKGWGSDLGGTFLENLKGVVSSWFVQARPDFLYNRPGPLLNASLLPWFVLGLVLLMLTLRHRYSRWILVWMLLFLLPVPILMNSQMGRVVYPGLPAVYATIALGMFLFWKEMTRLLGNLNTVFTAFGLAFLFWLPLLNFYIYFNEVTDATDRLIRREISDIATTAGGMGHLVLLPVIPGTDEPLVNEFQVIEMALHEKMPTDQVLQGYERVPYDLFLPLLTSTYVEIPYLEIILDKISIREREQRDAVYAALMECFPKGKLTTGVFFDRYTLDKAARQHPACVPVTLDLIPDPARSNRYLGWQLSAGTARQIHLECRRRYDDLVWVEAEHFSQAVGWYPETAFVIDWSADGFIMDTYGSQSAIYTMTIPREGSWYVWIRYYKRSPDNSYAFLSLDTQSFPFAGNTAELNTWVWEKLGPYQASATSHWLLNRLYTEDPKTFMALFVDSLVFTHDPAYDPRTSPSFESLPDQVFTVSGQSGGDLSLSFPPGHYQCQALATSSQPIVDALGNSPVASQLVEFNIDE